MHDSPSPPPPPSPAAPELPIFIFFMLFIVRMSQASGCLSYLSASASNEVLLSSPDEDLIALWPDGSVPIMLWLSIAVLHCPYLLLS